MSEHTVPIHGNAWAASREVVEDSRGFDAELVWERIVQAAAPHIDRAARIDELRKIIAALDRLILVNAGSTDPFEAGEASGLCTARFLAWTRVLDMDFAVIETSDD